MNASRSFNYLYRRAGYHDWQRHHRQQQILRSQQGFTQDPEAALADPLARPRVCEGCRHYHGIAYGWTQERRSRLICGFHPMGWQQDSPCPDWED